MKTYDDIYLIEHRAEPRRQMIYITPPFTAMLEDIGLMTAEMAIATQKRLLKQEMIFEHGVLRMFLGDKGPIHTPERDTGAIATYLT